MITNSKAGYIGTCISFNDINPKIYWTNPFTKWLEDNIAKVISSIPDFYNLINRDIIKKEKYFNNVFLSQNQENVVLDNKKQGVGFSVWVGNGKNLKNNFYVGVESSLEYTNLKLDYTSKDKLLLEFSEGTFFYRHGFNGKSYFSTDLLCNRNFALSAYIRIGYKPTSKILTYFKIGIGLNQCVFDKFNILIKNDITIDPFRNDGEFSSLFNNVPNEFEYKSSNGISYSVSTNLGVGLEYNLDKSFFIRTEYEFKLGFANKLKLLSDNKIDSNNFETFEYAIRYQDKINNVSFGIGKRF